MLLRAAGTANGRQLRPAEQALARSEQLRSRGNSAYTKGQWLDAETHYSLALNALAPDAAAAVASNLAKPFALLLSNRAAARLMRGRPHAALEDCSVALKVSG